jgi:hypothetical protein
MNSSSQAVIRTLPLLVLIGSCAIILWLKRPRA